METKYWILIKDNGFYDRVKAELKRRSEHNDIICTLEFWFDDFEGEKFRNTVKSLLKIERLTDKEKDDLLDNFHNIDKLIAKDTRNAKVSFNKSGGTAKGTAITNRVTIPTSWIKLMDMTEENREIKMRFYEDKIIIEKIN